MSKAPKLIGSSGNSLRESFGIALTELAPSYQNVVVLDADIQVVLEYITLEKQYLIDLFNVVLPSRT